MQKKFYFGFTVLQTIILCVLVLLVIGGVNVYSASFVSAADMVDNSWHFFFSYAAYAMLGLGVMYVLGWKIDYHYWFRYKWAFAFIMLALLVGVEVAGRTVNGATRWLSLGGVTIQPSEIVKLGIIVLGAGYLGPVMESKQIPELLKLKHCHALGFGFLCGGLVLLQPDMGTAAIIVFLIVLQYFLAGFSGKTISSFLAGLAGLAVVGVVIAPYRLRRVTSWLDPWADATGNGYQMVQSQIAIGSGGLDGMGMGKGISKYFFLPEAHTDFAFALYCQENGFVGVVFLLAIFAILLKALYQVIQGIKDKSGYLLVTGITFLVVGQAIANMAMVCGILPVIGVPLSFISYGGTSLIINLTAVGLVINVYRQELLQVAIDEGKAPIPFPNRRWKK